MIGFCYISIVLCWVRVSLRVSCFILGRFVLCLVYVFFFYGRPFFFFYFGVSSHWESPVLGYIDVESV